MSNIPPPAPKLADLPDTSLEDDANFDRGVQQILRTFDDDSASTNPAALLDDGALEDTSTTFGETNAQDMYERNLALFNESIVDRPLVDMVIPISELRDEYKKPKFIEQIDWLEEHGFHSIRRTRGDGDCFYRSFGFAFVERLFHAVDTHEAVRRAIEVLDATLPMFNAMAFDAISYEDSYNIFKELIRDIVGGDDGKITTEDSLVKTFQDLYDSNSIVYYLRLATAAQIQLAPDDYAPFLTNQDIPNSEETLEPQDFNARFVIPLGKEADDVQISALCRVFQMNVDIAYVDGREDIRDNAHKVRLVPFRSDIDEDAAPISLLYRPGHYDILVGKYHE
ncbi:Ubiquitin thioesterase otubain-like [Termitomyces sp. J132]|nr:Ubiquitin thioesterase otubain-like [Termitomyces sp. J132]